MPISVAVKPVNRSILLGTVNAITGAPVTYSTVSANSGTQTSGAVPIYFGSGGFTAYIYVKSGGGGAADVSLSVKTVAAGSLKESSALVTDVIAAAGTFTADNTWYAVDFTPHCSEYMFLEVTNADAITATDVVLTVVYGGA